MEREDVMQCGAFGERLQETLFLGNGRLCVLASETEQSAKLQLREMGACGLARQCEAAFRLALFSGDAQKDARQSVSEYARTLDLRRAMLCTEYRCGDTRYRVECFVSRRYQVAAVRLRCQSIDGCRPKRMALAVRLSFSESSMNAGCEKQDRRTLVVTGGGETAGCCGAARMLSDAPVSATGEEVHTAGAQDIVLFVACKNLCQASFKAESTQGESLRRETVELLTRAERDGYEAVRAAQEAEHAALYDRLNFQLGGQRCPERQSEIAARETALAAVAAVNKAKYFLLACGCASACTKDGKVLQSMQEMTRDGNAVARACGLEEYVGLCGAPPLQSIDATVHGACSAQLCAMQDKLRTTLCEVLHAARAAVETPAILRGSAVEILPALPEGWQTGKIQGLRLQNGLTINLEWENSAPVRLLVKAERDGTQLFRWAQKTARVPLLAGVWQEIMFSEQNANAEQGEGRTA